MHLTRRTLGSLAEVDWFAWPAAASDHFVPHLVERYRTRFRIAFQRAAVFLGANEVVGSWTSLLLGLHKDVIDFGLTVRDADNLRLGTGAANSHAN